MIIIYLVIFVCCGVILGPQWVFWPEFVPVIELVFLSLSPSILHLHAWPALRVDLILAVSLLLPCVIVVNRAKAHPLLSY